MLTRRRFLDGGKRLAVRGNTGHSAEDPARKKIAIIATVWTYQSHAQHMGDRFLVGYPRHGTWHKPPIDVVSLYVDQRPDGDLSAKRAAEHGFTIYKTIAEALRCGGDKLAVDGVVIIGEHGNYPTQQERADPLSSVRVLPASHRGLRQGRPRGPGVQRQAPVLQCPEGRTDGRGFEAAELPVPGRIVVARHLAAAAGGDSL